LEDQIPFDPDLHDGMAIDAYVENSGAVLKALAVLLPNVALVPTHGVRSRLAFKMRYA
jgi:hypothetical protein